MLTKPGTTVDRPYANHNLFPDKKETSFFLEESLFFCAPGSGERYYQIVFVSWPCHTAPGCIPSQVL